MSPERTKTMTFFNGFPRVSGDEPTTYPKPIREWLFSPRERG